MHFPRGPFLTACTLILLICPGSVHAQSLRIKDIRIGLPGGKDGRRCRIGAWSPVYVELAAGSEAIGAGDFELITETADSDDVRGQYIVAVPAIAKESTHTVLTYFRPGNRTARVMARVRRKGGAVIHSLDKEPGHGDIVGPDEVLYLTLEKPKVPLSGLRKALTPPRQTEGEREQEAQLAERAEHSIARIEHFGELPERWFGYDGVDIVVLPTSNTALVDQLLAKPAVTQALGEWLHRGGRLVIGVGDNSKAAGQLLKRLDVRGFTLGQAEPAAELREVQQWVEAKSDLLDVKVTPVQAPAGTLTLAGQHSNGKTWPVLVLTPCGLGRVLLVAFDLDGKEFTSWNGQELFWKRVHEELGPRPITRGKDQDAGDKPGELAAALQRGLEVFEEVPVISFGWVALLILAYILLIGPLDYFFLKKVVKRLELTWVTFPLIVLVVGVAAFVTAHNLKGNERRVNKIDVVDIDLRGGDVQGTTWLALFSPRLESYTLGVEPAWTTKGSHASAVVATLSPPDGSVGGVDRLGAQAVFRPVFHRPYNYAPQAAGLTGVPLPVWAARSFTASWRVKEAASKLIKVQDFGLSRDGRRLTGRIDNHLKAALHDVTLLYGGKAYALDSIPARGFYRIDAREIRRDSGSTAPHWLDTPFAGTAGESLGSRAESARKGLPDVPTPSDLIKTILFHGQEGGPYSHLNNSCLRRLDQGWRLRGFKVAGQFVDKQFLDEAILVGRAVLPAGPAEEVSQDGASATRLRLETLSGEGGLDGYLRQETYVRIYIPVPRNP